MASIWDLTLGSLTERYGRDVTDTWFKRVELLRFDRDVAILSVPTRFHRDYIRDSYGDAIEAEFSGRLGFAVRLGFELAEGAEDTGEGVEVPVLAAPDEPEAQPEPVAEPAPTPAGATVGARQLGLNPAQTFQTFVVGSNNAFAHAAAMNVANNPGQNYNPLFLFGSVGLGKTHLLNAIANQLLAEDPGYRIAYLSAEEFMNQMINSLRFERMEDFRKRFREGCDCLLIDDIQFLAGKGRTQEEFFHTFNFLHGARRQIVLTSDKFPNEIEGMEERLRTRFAMGLVADVRPPDPETKVAILKRKATAENFLLQDDVGMFIAEHTGSNIRDLEGTLTRLMAFASFYDEPVTVSFARRVLKGVLEVEEEVASLEGIQEGVAKFFNLRASDLRLARRTRVLTLPRQIAMYLCRHHTQHSLAEIGRAFGGRDHSTVLYAIRKVEKEMAKSAPFLTQVEAVRKSLRLSANPRH